jgi:hypothetical protein
MACEPRANYALTRPALQEALTQNINKRLTHPLEGRVPPRPLFARVRCGHRVRTSPWFAYLYFRGYWSG